MRSLRPHGSKRPTTRSGEIRYTPNSQAADSFDAAQIAFGKLPLGLTYIGFAAHRSQREGYMRNIFASGLFGFCLAALSASPLAIAQQPTATSPAESQTSVYVAPPQRDSRSYSLIHDRAVLKAQQRTARMENRMWVGQSSLRPNFGPGPGTADVFGRVDHGGFPRYGFSNVHYGPLGSRYVTP